MNKKMMIFWAYSPIATFVFGCIGFLLTMAQVEGEILTEQQQIISSIFIVLVLVSVILVYVSMVVFIVTVCKIPSFDNGKKVFWGLMFYFFNMFVYPIYLHKYVLRDVI